MTDDFHLFGDPDDGDRPIDPDLALMSAYIARELSPMQVLALEERLTTDASFRAAMQPLLDAWAAPVPSLDGGRSLRDPTLSEVEREATWRRFQRETSPVSAVRQVPQRRTTMKRAAAVIALVVVPMVSFAQVVRHAANNPDARGHAIAKRIVAPFARGGAAATSASQLGGRTDVSPNAPRAREVDAGSLLPVITIPVFVLESEQTPEKGQSPVLGALPAPVSPRALGMTTAQRREPNRARIAELAREHQPLVVNGDSAATYVVMVLDAADGYLWSTAGSGNLTIEVFGDTRTPTERREYNRQHYAEFWGSEPPPAVARGYAIGAARSVRIGTVAVAPGDRVRGGGGDRGAAPVAQRDSSSTSRDISGAVMSRMRRDSVLRVRIDTIERPGGVVGRAAGVGTGAGGDSTRVVLRSGQPVAIGSGIGRGGGGGVARRAERGSGLGGGGAEGTSPMLAFDKDDGTYRSGWYGTPNSAPPNQAEGLTAPGNGESGIAGLPSTSVSSAETYYFPSGELAPRALKIMVVHLTPGAVWNPR